MADLSVYIRNRLGVSLLGERRVLTATIAETPRVMELSLFAETSNPLIGTPDGALLWENSDRILLEDGSGVLLLN